MVKRMVVFGDSVPWGQGLLDQHKYHTIVQTGLGGATVSKEVLAHSGATIGVGTTNTGSANGEVPISYPTAVQQCDSFTNSPETVDLVLVTAAINDVDVRTILNPLTKNSDLSDDVEHRCHRDFKVLLEKLAAKFVRAQIVASGYFPIVSQQSDPSRLLPFLQMLGIGFLPHLATGPVLNRIAELSLQFRDESDQKFEQAVSEVSSTTGNRITYVRTQFTEDNSVFASKAFLFGLHLDLELSPEDEVIQQRHAACNITFSNPFDLLSREQCFRASAGHPNVAGAQQIAKVVLAAVTP
jgi:hypothetical protein